MGKEVATTLGLTWDPNIRINMESTSSHIEKTLGLARSVPFTVGGITIDKTLPMFFLYVKCVE